MKQIMARQNGLTFISVPCWWNGKSSSLLSAIQFHRPDITLLEHKNKPINLNPPEGYFKVPGIPEVGELMLASFPIYNFKLDESNYTEWWVGEKYDGVRCLWNNNYNQLYGKEIQLLSCLSSLLPNIFLDGELWFGRGQFAKTYMLVNGDQCHWPNLRLVAFDTPALELQDSEYETRLKFLCSQVPYSHAYVTLAPRLICNKSIGRFVEEIIQTGGEGIILQKSAAPYEHGRSHSLLKLKSTQADQEGIITDVLEDNSVVVKLASGIIFKVPASDVLVPATEVGDIVSFSFENNSRRDVPINPKIYRIRTDILWDDVVNNFKKEGTLQGTSFIKGFTSKPKGFWTPQNIRLYMENFAKSRNMDPLNPKTWYYSYKAIFRTKNGKTIIGKFKNQYFGTLQKMFPEVVFDPNTFKKSYNTEESRRKFFEKYAASHGFDPFKADNWYHQSKDDILATKGATRVMAHHGYNISTALVELFPNIGLRKSKLPYYQRLSDMIQDRRNFFSQYAAENGFDPLSARDWYLQPANKIVQYPGAKQVLQYYANSIPKALVTLFPNIGLDATLLANSQKSVARKINHRIYFQDFAAANGFDPLYPESWYKQESDNILAQKGIWGVLSYYGRSISNTLIQVFPDIGLEKKKFNTLRK